MLESLMPVVDLGTIDGPLLVFGGPYGNLEATAALMETAARFGFSGTNIVCTGDLVAYGADPQAVVDRIRSWGCAVVMGNCEESLALDAEDCGCGFAEGSTCAALSAQWFNATRRDLDADTKRWMGALPRRIEFTLSGRRLVAIHGGVAQINQFVFASTPAAEISDQIGQLGVDGIVAGHCGLPFSRIVDGCLWHNSGAVGMPANDGTPRVWFSVLTPWADGIAITHHALDYDHRAAALKMRARGYPVDYAAALGSGLWPSCDILPAEECRVRGQAIALTNAYWPAPHTHAAVDHQLDISSVRAV